MLEGVGGQQRGEQVREADVMLTISKIPPSTSSIVLVMKSSEPMTVLLSKKPDMMSRLQAMIEDRMDITREDATRHFLPVRAPPMVSPPVTKKNTELTIPTAKHPVVKHPSCGARNENDDAIYNVEDAHCG